MAILQTPYSDKLDISFEDDSITMSKERKEFFGQSDHVRIYGLDFFSRLEKSGFNLNIIRFEDIFSKDEAIKYGILNYNNLIMVYK